MLLYCLISQLVPLTTLIFSPRRPNQHTRMGTSPQEGQTTESGIPPGCNDSRRYTRIHLGYTGQGSTLIGRIAIVPVVDTCTRRYSAFRLLSLGVTFFCRDLYRLLAENTKPFATDGLGKCSTHSTIRATSSRTNTGRTHHAHALRPFRSIGNIRTYPMLMQARIDADALTHGTSSAHIPHKKS